MTSLLNLIFKDIELLNNIKVPFSENSEEYETVSRLICSPRLVASYQDVVKDIPDFHILKDIPWSVWLTTLCSRLLEGISCLEDVISVSQITSLRISVSKLVSFTLLPNISCQLPYPNIYSKTTLGLNQQQRSVIVDFVIRILMVLFKNDYTQNIVMKHYGEIIGTLISFNTNIIGNTDDDLKRKNYYKQIITSLLDDIHQPTVFTHLMILHSSKGDGGKVSRIVRKVLETKLQKSGGVSNLLGATILSDKTSSSTQDIMKISNLLVGKHPESFYLLVLPQVLNLLKEEDKRCHQIVAECISQLNEKDRNLCDKYFLSPILSPLLNPCNEGDIEQSILSLNKWIDASSPGIDLSKILPVISLLYSSISETPTALKTSLSQLLITCFNYLSFPCSYLIKIIFPENPGVKYKLTCSCNIVSIKCDDPILHENTSQIILNFINENKLDKIKIELFRNLLRFVIDSETGLEQKLISTNLLSELCSDQVILESLSNEPKYLIDFLTELFTKQFDTDSVSMGLILLNIFLNDDKFVHKKSNWEMIKKLEKPLFILKSSTNIEISLLSSEIFNRLNDLGIITVDKNLNDKKLDDNISDKGQPVDCDYEEAYRESIDPHLPVRAHALRTFAKLLQSKDKTTLNNKTTILHIFKSNLDDNDSYLYLSAVEGLSSLASVFPDDVITILCQEFMSKQSKPELRLKIGQVIVKTTNLMGEMGAVYKKELLGTLLIGATDPDPLVRASSLSNIGEIAKILSYRIHSYLVEIFNCVEKIVDSDKEMEPRRAAVMLVSLLLQGLGKDTFTVLEDILLDLYRKLKVIYQSDIDEITRLHAQIALEHLSHSTRSLLFSQPSLSKRISILDLNK